MNVMIVVLGHVLRQITNAASERFEFFRQFFCPLQELMHTRIYALEVLAFQFWQLGNNFVCTH